MGSSTKPPGINKGNVGRAAYVKIDRSINGAAGKKTSLGVNRIKQTSESTNRNSSLDDTGHANN